MVKIKVDARLVIWFLLARKRQKPEEHNNCFVSSCSSTAPLLRRIWSFIWGFFIIFFGKWRWIKVNFWTFYRSWIDRIYWINHQNTPRKHRGTFTCVCCTETVERNMLHGPSSSNYSKDKHNAWQLLPAHSNLPSSEILCDSLLQPYNCWHVRRRRAWMMYVLRLLLRRAFFFIPNGNSENRFCRLATAAHIAAVSSTANAQMSGAACVHLVLKINTKR